MSETVNIGEIAEKLSRDIFSVFHWGKHGRTNDNFDCVHDHHKTEGGHEKRTHPADVVFYYHDPYLDKRIYLHTDLKSYAKNTMRRENLKSALHSLAWTIECGNASTAWKDNYCVDASENYEVRGLLFVSNHDGKALDEFDKYYDGINRQALPLARGHMIHVLGPRQITNLSSVVTDIKLLKHDYLLPATYQFHYPDLTLWKRQVADDTRMPATIETLMSPYFVIKHAALKATEDHSELMRGSIVYYSRKGATSEEFLYLIDALSRAQLVQSREQIRIRVFNPNHDENLWSNFERAKHTYCKLWHFSEDRAQEIMNISIDTIQQQTPNYSPAKIGWKK